MLPENFASINDYHLFFQYLKKNDRPSEPVLVFLHDSWGCTEMWGDFPEKLTEIFGLNALVYDRRGYGKSSPFQPEERTSRYLHEAADELILLMDALKIDRAILYGHSDGGSIALIAAAAYPERIAAILVEGAHSFVEKKGKDNVRECRDRAQSNSLLQTLAKFHGSNTEELFRRWHTVWLSDFFADWSIIPQLQNIACPVLAFRGENDPFDTPEQLHVLEKEVCTPLITRIISRAEHTPRKENAPETLQLIQEFIRVAKLNFQTP